MNKSQDIVEKPWGWYKVLAQRPSYQVKELLVYPGHQLSYQSHKKRTEFWMIMRGTGKVMLNGMVQTVSSGQRISVECGMKHRISNTGDNDLVFIEIQTGEYFGEDDIVRYEDDYNRLTV
ncbi:MAG TPA: phosphomannose isomerase type II C-terminal cupin domain [Patescibacteria group bacterium]|nr:phosphomannose isomerase type II C-terminal cupin domain [Patescibacteria group bacterium]